MIDKIDIKELGIRRVDGFSPSVEYNARQAIIVLASKINELVEENNKRDCTHKDTRILGDEIKECTFCGAVLARFTPV